uniref:Uncharacterized protein n=1 Tax=Arundo donax TaxID=35708 RepID=A0A0A9FDX0_ARUDO
MPSSSRWIDNYNWIVGEWRRDNIRCIKKPDRGGGELRWSLGQQG